MPARVCASSANGCSILGDRCPTTADDHPGSQSNWRDSWLSSFFPNHPSGSGQECAACRLKPTQPQASWQGCDRKHGGSTGARLLWGPMEWMLQVVDEIDDAI